MNKYDAYQIKQKVYYHYYNQFQKEKNIHFLKDLDLTEYVSFHIIVNNHFLLSIQKNPKHFFESCFLSQTIHPKYLSIHICNHIY